MARKNKKKQGATVPLNADAFIIGNGTSRKDLDVSSLQGKGVIYGPNYFFRDEFLPDVIVASDEPMTRTLMKAHSSIIKSRPFYTWFHKTGSGSKKATCPEKFATGAMAAWTAVNDHQAKAVFLIGMDFFGFGSKNAYNNGKLNNLYAGKKHYLKDDKSPAPTYRNWQRRFQFIVKSFPTVQFYHVNPFEGKSPERLIGLENFHQITWENLQGYLNNGDELEDIKTITEEDYVRAMEPNPDDVMAVLERQLVGQENVIFKDFLSVDQVISIHKQIAKLGNPQGGTVQIFGMNINVQGLPVASKTGQITTASPEQVEAIIRNQQATRERIMKSEWKRLGVSGPIPLPVPAVAKPKPPKQKAESLIPPPPPPVFA